MTAAESLSSVSASGGRRVHPLLPMLRMALGHEAGAPLAAADWWDAYRLSVRERCAALAWLRCGDVVRSQAPDELVREWRAGIVRQYDRGEALVSRVGRTMSRLVEHGIPCIVLKGAPLAAHLYGDPLVRPMDDVDLLVPRECWERAAKVLEDDGWSKELGRKGWSEIYRLADARGTLWLDMQSSLLVDHLDHLPGISGTIGRWHWRESVFPTYVGPEVAVFLAVHLLKHQLPPVLWLIDFHTCWDRMSENERREAMRIARASRAHRYLLWAVARSSLLLKASCGVEGAMRQLGFYPSFRRDAYGMLRLTALAASVPDVVAVLGAWAWPRPLRYDWAAFRRMWQRRGTKSISRVVAARRLYLDPRDRSDVGARTAAGRSPSPSESLS